MPPPTEYIELHLHTAFSFLDGASMPQELLGRAAELGYPALAITDHDGLHGVMEFAQAARAVGIAPITGAEVTLVDGSHLTLLVETHQGYENLCRLLTHAYVHTGHAAIKPEKAARSSPEAAADPRAPYDHYRDPSLAPQLDPALLAGHAAGLILLTGCRHGGLARLADADRMGEAEALLRRYVAWFGSENVAVELQQNLVHGDSGRIRRLVALANRVGVPYVATGNVHYHLPERHRLQDVLVAIRHRTTLDGSHRERRPNAGFFLRSPTEMAALFGGYPAALRASVAIGERCAAFDLTQNLAYRFPTYDTPTGESAADYLERLCREKLAERYRDNPQIAETRLLDEMRLIRKHELAGFFLIHHDLLELAREVAVEVRGADTPRAKAHLPPGRGRGSSVSSIVCYLIGLSPVDPVAYKLSFGRFLNEEIRSVPDIDLDFPRDIRERLIARIHEDYGDRVAQVCAFATYQMRSAVRDVGKALGIQATDLDRIAKVAEPGSATKLAQELERIPAYAARKDVPPWSYLIELANQLAGFPRHISQHSGGMIVSSQPITGLVPVQPAAMAGRYLCQWDKDSCDDARFVKIDFLALGMLSLVEECMDLIAASGEPVPDLSRIDLEEEAVYEMIRAGDTIGTFQIESRAQIQTLLKTQPRTLDDLVIQVAIVRPGPILGGATTPYVRSREHALAEPIYDHPLLIPVLEETRGVVIFQEQVIDAAMALAGFTAGQADALRRAMSRKRSEEAMMAMWEQFRKGAESKGVPDEVAKTVFHKLLGFSSYGFPKGHAASFAVLAFQSCWLKLHHPAEFVCALLNNQPMGFYPSHVLVNDAKRHGIRVVPPDVNLSAPGCSVEPGRAVRIGLGYVKGLGKAEAAAIVAERAKGGPFRSLADFVRRVPLGTEIAERLIAVGAFDAFGLRRREALWQLGLFVVSRQVGQKVREATLERAAAAKTRATQTPLPLPVAQDMVPLAAMPAWDRMAAEYQILGLSPHFHPLGLLRTRLPECCVTTKDLETLPDGTPVRFAGLVVCRQRPGTAKGVTFLLLEDEHGLANAIVYPSLYQEYRLLVRAEPFLLVEGLMQRSERNINIIATRFHRLADVVGTLGDTDATPELTLDPHPTRATTARPEPRPEDVILEILAPKSHSYR